MTSGITPCPALPNFTSNALILRVKTCSTCQPCKFNLQALSLSFLSSVPGAERAQAKNSCNCYYLPPKYQIQISLENYRAAKMIIMDWALAADSTEAGKWTWLPEQVCSITQSPKKVLQLSNAKLKNRKSWNNNAIFGLFNWFLLVLLAKQQQSVYMPSTVSSTTWSLLHWAFPPHMWGTAVSDIKNTQKENSQM